LRQIDFPVVVNSRGKSLDWTQSWNLWKVAVPICCFTRYQKLFILVPGGLRDFFDGAKCSQWPYLYRCYEAIYTLKCSLFEKIAKNWFLAPKSGFSQFSWENLEYLKN
jgi:hypothetical protein